ncbi:MAG: phosphoribosyl-AMP cyclohydrolase [Gammaproteobacteria bacterium]|jgi:phosphoribosyl-AMP cyclohydrolase|nr:phosphoribosyl-AMP cyclohydrolase [Pseudomonadales bacterium]MBT6480915.1 phosphoribosyl-AMP cyclohydrolase [Gammaproteobacteria bacterium]MBT7226120.1 phosphoribosyl-AMP cyclohydrolase [Gammaproteobacteria bacterium]MDC0413581.1 phosphoribosyl-AMP cyclohydrolase [Gammaproteobacteria bacterium]
MPSYLDQIQWNEQGLVPVITQDAGSGRVLTQAWVNREALKTTVSEGRAVYWSRSRSKLWRKGEESGMVQKLVEVLLDCDNDSLCYRVEQLGGIACHTGRESCFYKKLTNESWESIDPVLVEPDQLYKTS